MNFGRVAYDAYCEHTGGVSLVSGAKLPVWDDLPPAIKDAWIVGADAVRLKEQELRAVGQVIQPMFANLPPEKQRSDHKIRRVTRVVLTWNAERQAWDASEPEGVSNYVEPASVQQT